MKVTVDTDRKSSKKFFNWLKQFPALSNQLVGAAFGAAGQRCMALTTAVWVGEARDWIPEMVERAKQLKVNAGKLMHRDGQPI